MRNIAHDEIDSAKDLVPNETLVYRDITASMALIMPWGSPIGQPKPVKILAVAIIVPDDKFTVRWAMDDAASAACDHSGESTVEWVWMHGRIVLASEAAAMFPELVTQYNLTAI